MRETNSIKDEVPFTGREEGAVARCAEDTIGLERGLLAMLKGAATDGAREAIEMNEHSQHNLHANNESQPRLIHLRMVIPRM